MMTAAFLAVIAMAVVALGHGVEIHEVDLAILGE